MLYATMRIGNNCEYFLFQSKGYNLHKVKSVCNAYSCLREIFQISDEEYSETLSLINMSATYSVTMQS